MKGAIDEKPRDENRPVSRDSDLGLTRAAAARSANANSGEEDIRAESGRRKETKSNGGDGGHRAKARGDGAGGADIGCGADRIGAPRPRRRNDRRRLGERGRILGAEPRPRPEPGGDAWRFVRTDRARSAG